MITVESYIYLGGKNNDYTHMIELIAFFGVILYRFDKRFYDISSRIILTETNEGIPLIELPSIALLTKDAKITGP